MPLDVNDVLLDVDDVLLALVISVLLPQGVPRVELVSGLVTDVVTDVSGLGVGSATSGLVTGSNVLVAGRPIIGLTPKLVISADPSGIPTRVADDPVAVSGIAGAPEDEAQLPNTGESVEPAAEVPVGVDMVPFMDVVPLTPPPSKSDKVESNAVIADADVGAVEQPVPLVELSADSEPDVDNPPVVVGEIEIVVLKPPGLSSTEPRGMPVGPTVVRGDVVPIAGGVPVVTCARLGPLGNNADTAMAINRAVILSLWSFRIGFHRAFTSLGVVSEESRRRGVQTGVSPGRRQGMMAEPWNALFRKRARICVFARCGKSVGLVWSQTKV